MLHDGIMSLPITSPRDGRLDILVPTLDGRQAFDAVGTQVNLDAANHALAHDD
jgi:hypothetical protein